MKQPTSDYYNRLMNIATALGYKKTNFMLELGYKNPINTLQSYQNSTKKLSDRLVLRLQQAFPRANVAYLKHGTDPVLLDASQVEINSNLNTSITGAVKVPFYRVAEGDKTDPTMMNWKEQKEVFVYVSEFKNATAYMEVRTRSMSPTILERDVIPITKTPLELIPQNEVCYIVTKTAYHLARIYVDEKEIHLNFANPDYKSQKIPIKSVKEIFTVNGLIRLSHL